MVLFPGVDVFCYAISSEVFAHGCPSSDGSTCRNLVDVRIGMPPSRYRRANWFQLQLRLQQWRSRRHVIGQRRHSQGARLSAERPIE